MASKPLTPLSRLGEFGLIHHIASSVKLHRDSSVKGIGDDAAVIRPEPQQAVLVTTDMLVEGVHFDFAYTPLKHLGYKAVAVNLSDLAAMNAEPGQITVSIALSNHFTLEAVDEIYEGIRTACDKYQVDLVGGDTTSSQKGLILSITAIGSASMDQVVYRSGSKADDLIYVSGDLGAAYLGLLILQREKEVLQSNPEMTPDFEGLEYLIGRQLKPEPRFDVLDALRLEGIQPTAMIDISDGLSSELIHLCTASKTGCVIEEAFLPYAELVDETARKMNLSPLTCVLNGGEDYELLLTVPSHFQEKMQMIESLTYIGRMNAQSGQFHLRTHAGQFHLRTHAGQFIPLRAQGWNPLLEAKEKYDRKG